MSLPQDLLQASTNVVTGLPGAALGGVVDTVFGQLNNAINDKRSREYARFINDMNIKNWQMQNDYNKPSAQIARLLEAGLNPSLIYGTSASGGVAGDVKSTQGFASANPSVRTSPIEAYTAFKNAQNLEAVNNNLKEQNNDLKATIALKNAQRIKTLYDALGVRYNNDYLSRTLDDRVKQVFNQTLKSEEEVNQAKIETYRAERALDKIALELNLLSAQIEQTKTNTDLTKVKIDLENAELKLRQNGFSFQDPAILRVLVSNYPDLIPSVLQFLDKQGIKAIKFVEHGIKGLNEPMYYRDTKKHVRGFGGRF